MEITYGFYSADLFSFDEAEQYDERASAERYAEQVRKAIQDAYPGASVEVLWQSGATGCLPEGLKTRVDGMTTSLDAMYVDEIAGDVFAEFGWMVEAE